MRPSAPGQAIAAADRYPGRDPPPAGPEPAGPERAGPERAGPKRAGPGLRDGQIERIVAMVDSLPDRGAADALIAPLRPRLARVKVGRPLNFARLLFMPLDPLIVPAAAWRPGRMRVPRGALAPLAQGCRATLGDAVGRVERVIAGRRTDDGTSLREAGGILWPLAAKALALGVDDAEWSHATGLGAEAQPEILRVIIAVLREACEIEDLVAQAVGQTVGQGHSRGQSEMSMIRQVLGRPARAGDASGLAALVAVLLARLPSSERVLAAVGEMVGGGDPPVTSAADQAVDVMLAGIDAAAILAGDGEQATEELRRVVALLDGVERPGSGHRPARRQAGAVMRARLRTACAERLAADLGRTVLEPLRCGEAGRADGAQASLEAAARQVRGFEEACRPLGGDANQASLRHAAEALRDAPGPLVDRMRLAEILLGSDRVDEVFSEKS